MFMAGCHILRGKHIVTGGIAYQQLKQQSCTVPASVQGGGRLSLYGESQQKRNKHKETLQLSAVHCQRGQC